VAGGRGGVRGVEEVERETRSLAVKPKQTLRLPRRHNREEACRWLEAEVE
jgi:hypothetical protein